MYRWERGQDTNPVALNPEVTWGRRKDKLALIEFPLFPGTGLSDLHILLNLTTALEVRSPNIP